ncbi:MAG: DUF2155 domain-containing protein [Rickettsiaceae bacterium]|nr:MAG: DUF2155 domain-containing protein [Rickettsiaceae bacterium]
MNKNLISLLAFICISFCMKNANAFDITKQIENSNITQKFAAADIFDEPIRQISSDYEDTSLHLINIVAINKITAKIKNISLKPKEFEYFGNIKIIAHSCHKIPIAYDVDYQALFGISEEKIDEDSEIVFQGWMFSSDISLSTFEHPVYEVFLQSCS